MRRLLSRAGCEKNDVCMMLDSISACADCWYMAADFVADMCIVVPNVLASYAT